MEIIRQYNAIQQGPFFIESEASKATARVMECSIPELNENATYRLVGHNLIFGLGKSRVTLNCDLQSKNGNVWSTIKTFESVGDQNMILDIATQKIVEEGETNEDGSLKFKDENGDWLHKNEDGTLKTGYATAADFYFHILPLPNVNGFFSLLAPLVDSVMIRYFARKEIVKFLK